MVCGRGVICDLLESGVGMFCDLLERSFNAKGAKFFDRIDRIYGMAFACQFAASCHMSTAHCQPLSVPLREEIMSHTKPALTALPRLCVETSISGKPTNRGGVKQKNATEIHVIFSDKARR